MAAGDPATYQRDNRKAWWPGELSLEGGAASSVYRCATHLALDVQRAGDVHHVTSQRVHRASRCHFR